MRTLIIMALCALIAGCGSVSSNIKGEARGGPVIFGTVAPFGTFEMQLAPTYTRLAVLRHNSARALREDRITVEQALSIQADADRARAALDKARSTTASGKYNPAAVSALHQAEKIIVDAKKILEAK